MKGGVEIGPRLVGRDLPAGALVDQAGDAVAAAVEVEQGIARIQKHGLHRGERRRVIRCVPFVGSGMRRALRHSMLRRNSTIWSRSRAAFSNSRALAASFI